MKMVGIFMALLCIISTVATIVIEIQMERWIKR